MSNIETIIFDMDGVIVDSEPLQVESYNQVLRKYNIFISKHRFKYFVGKKQSEIFAEIKENNQIEESIENLIAQKRDCYLKLVKAKMVAMPGLSNLVRCLKDKGLGIGIASSSPLADIKTILRCIKMEEQFDRVVSAENLEQGKPNPDVFLLAAKELNTTPEQCIVIEDTNVGVLAAKRANMKCIAMPNYFTRDQDFSSADFIVDDLYEAQEVIESLLVTCITGRRIG